MKLAILLTATVKVQAVGGNFTTEERANMYSSTLRYYAKTIGKKYPIVFLENSDYDLYSFKNEFDSLLEIEWIKLVPSMGIPFDNEKGKGYNEYLMIKEGICRSEKLKQCTHFMKITGRYAMLNVLSIIKEVENRCEGRKFMGDIKDTNLYQIIGSNNIGHWGDSRFWVADIDYYRSSMADCYKEMDDFTYGQWAEDYFLNFSKMHRNDCDYIFRFNHQVQFDGISGVVSHKNDAKGNMNYNSWQSRIKNHVRYALRLLFPNIWF